MNTPDWICWQLAADRHVLELHEAQTPAGCALEFELLDGGGVAQSFGVWRFSETGAVLVLVPAGQA